MNLWLIILGVLLLLGAGYALFMAPAQPEHIPPYKVFGETVNCEGNEYEKTKFVFWGFGPEQAKKYLEQHRQQCDTNSRT